MRYIFLILLTMSLSSCSEKGRMVANRYLTPVDTLNVEIGAPGLIKILGNQLFVDYSFSGEYNIDVIDIQHVTIDFLTACLKREYHNLSSRISKLKN